MTRWLAGIFDPHAAIDHAPLAGALSPHACELTARGPLRVAYTGANAPDGATLCLLDGHLDNAAALRAELGAPLDWRAEELLALGWREWGAAGLLPRLRGDFALLIWDGERDRGLLARDQLGARSIFLHERWGGICFAGEIAHLLALLPRRPAPDPTGLAHWLTMRRRPGAGTLYEGVRRLDPGTALLFDRVGLREQTYWSPRFAEPLNAGEPQLAQRMRASLDRAVQRRIGNDGLTGVLMSGGLDSASVAALAGEQAPERVRLYSGVFPEHPAVDESELIEQLQGALGLAGATAEVRPGGLIASAVEFVQAWQLPPAGWGDFWTLPLLRAASSAGVRVMLGGDGGDELFGVRLYLMADRLRAGQALRAARLTRLLPGLSERMRRRDVLRMMAGVGLSGLLPYRLHALLRRPLRAREIPAWLSPALRVAVRDSDDPLAWKRLDGPRWWAEIAHGLTRGIEETGVFEHQRRRAALAGLQARHPLLDLDLVELGLRQPPLATFDRNRSRPVLRAAMAGALPDAVRMRPQKALFDSVLIDTLAGPDGAAVQRLLGDPRAELGAYIDLDAMRQALLDSDRCRREQPFRWMWQVWRLAAAECWLRAQAGRTGQALVHASSARVTVRSTPRGAVGAISSVFHT